ncbi:YetF domain-containing protein [Phenylobacterium sp.]|uniref:DUF421 domain-containing protein n=1 Tax=Phenylobacterium sp. TaxID=1871053 RepID=UPI0030F37DC4
MISSSALFDGWDGIARILIIAPAAYLGLTLVLRASGKRTLAKLNAFDFVVTVALGSTLASIITSKDLALVEGLTALALLVGMQFALSWATVRSRRFNDLVKAEPTLLLRSGRLLTGAMRAERITEDEVVAAVRQAGSEQLDDAEAVFLEADGSLTALLRAPAG